MTKQETSAPTKKKQPRKKSARIYLLANIIDSGYAKTAQYTEFVQFISAAVIDQRQSANALEFAPANSVNK